MCLIFIDTFHQALTHEKMIYSGVEIALTSINHSYMGHECPRKHVRFEKSSEGYTC